MNLSERQQSTLIALLKVEHSSIALKLGFISIIPNLVNDDLLKGTINLIDELSRDKDVESHRVVVIATAIIWTYRRNEWGGLKDFLIVVLCRIGFSPSSIMIDKEYDFETGRYSFVESLIAQFAISVHQIEHEIFIKEKKYLVTSFQKRIWKKLSEVKLLGISAPTSAGKSFIILLKCVDLLIKEGGTILYIVPTLSLVTQVAIDFKEVLKSFDLSNVRVSSTYSSLETQTSQVLVLTQEKAITAFSYSDYPFNKVTALIVDEIQNIERVSNEGDQRAKTLYDTLIEIRHSSSIGLIVLSGPRVEGLKKLGIDIFDEKVSDEERTKDSPVASFTYAISKTKDGYYFNQYSDVINTPNRILITNPDLIKGYGSSHYKDDFLGYLSQLIQYLGNDSRNIIFSPTTTQARNTAVKLANLQMTTIKNPEVDSLIAYIKSTVHEKYDMCSTLSKGIVYHHGKTPSHIRFTIERAIKDKLIANVACTTTLMQGVNLPAQNVIMRNPDLAIKARNGSKPKLTNYEIANLRGRAGRLLKDFIGRTFILEENSFERTTEQGQLFPEEEKILRSGYGEKFLQFRDEIVEGLELNTTQTVDNKEYGFLLTYVRQTILKHKKNSIRRLSAVGIEMSKEQLDRIESVLKNQFDVPDQICYQNRYWDPLDLNVLYKNITNFVPPTSVFEDNVEQKLLNVLTRLRIDFLWYYKKYFDVAEKQLLTTCITAKDWMREKTLKDILSNQYFDTAEKIDDKIALIQSEISFGLPMLLKPIYDILYPDSMFLRFIELGAYLPITRKLIELNIPRETAIYLNTNHFYDFSNDENNLEARILEKLRVVVKNLDYWRRIQVDQFI